jgi:acetyl-CoA carboxylase biotin carboxyl carrier protein
MDREFIFELIEKIKNTKIEHIEIETSEGKVKVKQHIAPKVIHQTKDEKKAVEPTEVVHYETKSEETEKRGEAEEKKYHVIKSPLVGTFYRAPSPGAPPFVEEGDIVSKGQVLCIIEALKVMNEIESDIDGKVVKILVENGEPVEYGQELFYIEPLK